MNKQQLIIFDTTLRDGEQSPGASMTLNEKLRIALALEKLGVDVIEAGFANASNDDFKAIETIAQSVTDSRICSLSRAIVADIERSAEALRKAAKGRIHVFIATSPLHMQHKLKMSPDDVLNRTIEGSYLCPQSYR